MGYGRGKPLFGPIRNKLGIEVKLEYATGNKAWQKLVNLFFNKPSDDKFKGTIAERIGLGLLVRSSWGISHCWAQSQWKIWI